MNITKQRKMLIYNTYTLGLSAILRRSFGGSIASNLSIPTIIFCRFKKKLYFCKMKNIQSCVRIVFLLMTPYLKR